MAEKEYLNGEEATEDLQNTTDQAFGALQMLVAHMYYCGKQPGEIKGFLDLMTSKAYDWLHDTVEQSGHGIAEASEALINNDLKAYDKIIDDFDAAVEKQNALVKEEEN